MAVCSRTLQGEQKLAPVNVTTKQPTTYKPMANAELLALMNASFKELREHSIVRGTILDIKPPVVLVDIG